MLERFLRVNEFCNVRIILLRLLERLDISVEGRARLLVHRNLVGRRCKLSKKLDIWLKWLKTILKIPNLDAQYQYHNITKGSFRQARV